MRSKINTVAFVLQMAIVGYMLYFFGELTLAAFILCLLGCIAIEIIHWLALTHLASSKTDAE